MIRILFFWFRYSSFCKTWALWLCSLLRRKPIVLIFLSIGFIFPAFSQSSTSTEQYLQSLTNNVQQLITLLDEFHVSIDTNIQELVAKQTNGNQQAVQEIVQCQAKIDNVRDQLANLLASVGDTGDSNSLLGMTYLIQMDVLTISEVISEIGAFLTPYNGENISDFYSLLDEIFNQIQYIGNDVFSILSVLYQWYDDWSNSLLAQSLYWSSVTGNLERIIEVFGGGGGEGSSGLIDFGDVQNVLEDIKDELTPDWSSPHLYFTDWLEDAFDYDFWDDKLFDHDEGELDDYSNESLSDNIGVGFNNLTKLLIEVNEGVARLVFLLSPTNVDFETDYDDCTNRAVEAFTDGTNAVSDVDSSFRVSSVASNLSNDWSRVSGFLDTLFPSQSSFETFVLTVEHADIMGHDFGTLTFNFDWLVPFINMLRGLFNIFYIVLAFVGEYFLLTYIAQAFWKVYNVVNDFLSR